MKYSVENPVRNYTLPVPDIYYRFKPDRAYGLGEFDSTNIQQFYFRAPPSPFLHTADGFMVVGDEWENVSPRSYGDRGDRNSAGECPGPTDAQAEYARRMTEKAVERRLTVAGLLMGQAREMAEKRLKERVKFAVVTVPSPLDISQSKQFASTPPVPSTEGLVRGGLHFLRILEQSEAAVLAYEPQIVKAEQASSGRPQIIVFYYLNIYGEGMVVFETKRDSAAEDFLRLKTVAKYHFYQSVRERMAKALAQHIYEQYQDGSYKSLDAPREDCEDCEQFQDQDPANPKEQTLIALQREIHQLSDDSRSWPMDDAENDAKEERFFVSTTEYVVMTRQQWRDFERAWLKTHFAAMLDRAYEKSGVEVGARPLRIDHFLIVDESRYRQRTSSIMREALGGSAELNELVDPTIEHKFGPIVSHGAVRVADYLTKRSSLHSCL
ncbi:unnamed protein product [Mortierella alpina]